MSQQHTEVERELEDLRKNVNAAFAKISELQDRIDELETENADLRSQLEDAEEFAKTALGVAEAVDSGERGDGGPSKKRRAQLLSRDECVRRAIMTGGRGGAVTAGQVKDMALPQTQLYHQTVRDAWDTLVKQWGIFRVDEDNEPQRLVVDEADLRDHEQLVAAVEENLDDADLSKRLLSRSAEEGR